MIDVYLRLKKKVYLLKVFILKSVQSGVAGITSCSKKLIDA